ncbi:transcription termination/antitermination factor NusG [bacterium]|nr:transcription termination/antitermination factor NusG [bacterium]
MEELYSEKQWYVVNSYSGHENKVKNNLERRIESMNMQEYIFQVLVAEEEVPVMREGMPTGKMRIKNIYPGYVFVEMIMTDQAWFVVRNTPGVTGFVGSSGGGTKPIPVPKEQIDTVLKKVGIVNKDMYADYLVGTEVRVLRGPLAGSTGVIVSVDAEKDLVSVNATMFGRVTNVELDFADIEKI